MTKILNEYNKKRNFDKTSEPKAKTKPEPKPETLSQKSKGEKSKNQKSKSQKLKVKKSKDKKSDLKFVVQHHLARNDHFDFRLEWQGALLSWAVPKGPSFNPKDKRLAIQVEDHPLDYRNFEGTIPKGEYGGGTVMLWDEGTWSPLNDIKTGLKEGTIKFNLNGKRLKGNWALIKLKGKDNENNWILLKENDEFALKKNDISKFNTSIRTGRTMQEIENKIKKNMAKNPFKTLEVQLVQSVNIAPETDDWIYEIKYDGYRIIAFVENNEVKLVTRNKTDFTHYFSKIANSLIALSAGRAMILDGEIVITNKGGKTDFQLLQNHMKKSGENPSYVIFDLLALDGKDLRKQPLLERKQILENLLKNSPENISYSAHIAGNGKEIFQEICKLGLEGIVGKKSNSVYSGTRNGDWIKLKCVLRQEFVIGGYTLTGKKTSGVSSLLLGYYENEKLIYAGRSGTGMTHKISTEIEKTLKSISQKKCPFEHISGIKKNEVTIYVKPIIVAEIQFAEWTQENLLRQASFKGIRSDKNPKDVIKEKFIESNLNENINNEQIKIKKTEKPTSRDKTTGKSASKAAGKTRDKLKQIKEKQNKDGSILFGEIKITNPNKILYNSPEIKKIDIVRYYSAVSRRMLPFLESRLISIVRCPKGISEPCFFKKHPVGKNKGIVSFLVKNGKGENSEFYYIKDLNGLILEAQMSTLEFHTWGSKVDNLEKPDIMVFDLDPHEGLELKQVRQGVLDLKSILDKLSLVSFLKTSGGKGYHIVIPFKPSANWDKFYEFSKNIAEIMVQQWPERYTNNIRKSNRKNKIFIDYMRNGKGATSIAPYSLRARAGASVSMPIFWKELNMIAPNDIKMSDALKRLSKSDPWKNFFKTNQEIKV